MEQLLEQSLADIASISLHFSSDCNMACKYCYIEKDKVCMAAHNREIRAALQDGTFAKNVITKAASCKNQIENLSLWGAEPTINSKLFKNFIYELLDFFPNVTSLMFSTNALLGADLIYNDFMLPLLEYAEKHHRKMMFQLQLSLDGPPEFNDESRHAGATEHTLETMRLILQKMPRQHDFFSLEISTKATLDIYYIRQLIAGGKEKLQWYYDFFDKVRTEADKLCEGKTTIHNCIGGAPTLVDPGYHTQDDGRALAQWINMLKDVDRSHFTGGTKNNPLFVQGLSGFELFLGSDNPQVDSINMFSCSASKCNITIDYAGNLYTCNRLCRNTALGGDAIQKHAMKSNTTVGGVSDAEWVKRTFGSFAFHDNLQARFEIARGQMFTLAACGQIAEKYGSNRDEQLLLYMALQGFMCHIGAEEDYTQNPFLMPFSYYRYLGNGAVDALLDYYKIEVLRGIMRPWKIAM